MNVLFGSCFIAVARLITSPIAVSISISPASLLPYAACEGRVTAGARKFPVYSVPGWPWLGRALSEGGSMGPLAGSPVYHPGDGSLTLGLDAFQGRVFTT